MNIAIGHDHDAGAGWHGCNNIALWREVGSVIIDGLIAEEARGVSAHLRQVWQVENKDAARIMGRDIVEHIRIDRVLDLDPGDIEFRAAVLDDDIFGLTDIDARVRRTLYGHAVDQDIGRGHGIDTVGAVLFVRTTRPFDPDIDEADFVRPLGLDPITAAVFYGEVADRDAIRGNEQAFTRALLALEGQDRRFGACALDRHIIDIEREPVSQVIPPRCQLNHIAGLGIEQCDLDRLLRIWSGVHRNDLGLRHRDEGRSGDKGECETVHYELPEVCRLTGRAKAPPRWFFSCWPKVRG